MAWSRGRRTIVDTVVSPIEQVPRKDMPRGGTWIVTGGARGITAETVLELGSRYGWRLHLIGTAPVPRADDPWRNSTPEELKTLKASVVRQAVADGVSPEDRWDRIKRDVEIYGNLRRFAHAGVRATYYSCDVSNWDALGAVLEQVRKVDGPIVGIIHGAGCGWPARFETMPFAKACRVFQAKADGAMALMDLTRYDPVRWFIGYGSLSGRFGGNGLSDYAAANDMLAKTIDWYRRRHPECAATCFHWQTWQGVGMATLVDDLAMAKNRLKMEFIPAIEAVDHLHQELRAGLPESEVLITDGHFQRLFYGHERSVTPASPSPAVRPLIEAIEPGEADVAAVAGVKFDPESDPFLTGHRLRGKPFLPGVIGLETLAEAAAAWNPQRCVTGLRNVEITQGMLFHGSTPITARVLIRAHQLGADCLLATELRDRKGRLIQSQRKHVHGIVEFADSPIVLAADPPDQPPLGWFPYQYPDDGLIWHSEPFRCLKECSYQDDGGWGKIAAPAAAELAGTRSAEGWLLPAAMLDACLVFCGSYAYLQFDGSFEVPGGFDRLQMARWPKQGESCIVRMYFRGRQPDGSRFDFTLFDADNRALLSVEGYRTLRLVEGTS